MQEKYPLGTGEIHRDWSRSLSRDQKGPWQSTGVGVNDQERTLQP